MAVPKRRVSKQRKRKRRGDVRAEAATLVRCEKCGDYRMPHRVCRSCGTYGGQQVLEVEEEL
ncbi:MAG TPA: 50S ribosomal protein L32 [Longimicrobiales bacterium]|nr:50S ribosomal protein L32 [Longimicrobiales bacterium]